MLNFKVCPERARLTECWEERVAQYSEAVIELSKLMGTLSQLEYNQRRSEVEKRKLAMDNAHLALRFHDKEHRC